MRWPILRLHAEPGQIGSPGAGVGDRQALAAHLQRPEKLDNESVPRSYKDNDCKLRRDIELVLYRPIAVHLSPD